MDVLDEGGYGCVIRPPLNCQHAKPTSRSMISKLQLAKHAEYEMKQINKIKKICKEIPHCQDYVATNVKICDPVLPKRKNNSTNKTGCSLLEEESLKATFLTKHQPSYNRTTTSSAKTPPNPTAISKKQKTKKNPFKIINLPFLGTNLHRYLLDKADFSQPQTFVQINNAIIHLYQNFILVLNKHKFYHNDIKTLNIMVDKHGTYRLIDWGIANKIIFNHTFVFNKPYMYVLLSNYFLDKIEAMKQRGPLQYLTVKNELVLPYLELIKLTQESNYVYVKEVLELLFPNFTTSSNEEVNPVLVDFFVQTAMRYKSKKEWVEIYTHNLDIAGVALIYPDILCAIAMKKQLRMKLYQGILTFFTKYVLECFDKINPQEFIDDLNKLNMLVL